MANDIIINDDEQVQGLTLNQAVEKMRGPANTKIKSHHHAQGSGQADRRDHRARRDPVKSRLQHRGRRCRLYPRHPIQRADHRRSEK